MPEQRRRDLLTKHVFVDPSVHVAAKFTYTSGNFRRLTDLGEGGLAIIASTLIDQGEVQSNIAKHAEEVAGSLRSFRREAPALRSSTAPEIAALFHELDPDVVKEHLLQGYYEMARRAKVKQLSIPPEAAQDVFDQYFTHQPPFGIGKKRSEFPDAFIIATLAQWCRLNDALMYIVTLDKGFADAASATKVLFPLSRLEDFLDLIVSSEHQDLALRVHKWIDGQRDNLAGEIKGSFVDSGFYIEDADGDAENVEVEDLRVGEPLLVEVSQDSAVFSMPIEVTYQADISYDDPTTGSYDSEDKVMFFMDRVRVRVRVTDELRAEATIEFNIDTATGDLDAGFAGITIRNGRDIPISIDSEVVEVYRDDDAEDYDWYSEPDSATDQPVASKNDGNDNPDF